jgi:hypothetical protein
MKCLIVTFVLFCAVPVLADSFKGGIEKLSFDTANNSAGATIFIHGVTDGHGFPITWFASASDVNVLSLTCAKSCAGFNATVAMSGLTTSGIFNGQSFSTIYLDGTLTLTAKFVPSLPFELGQITGTFQACADLACNTPLFSFFTNTTARTSLNVINRNGTLTLTGGLSTVPEPTTVALLGTGCLFLIGVAREKCKRKVAVLTA